MLCLIIVIAFCAPSLALKGNDTGKNNVKNCTDPGAMVAGDTFFTCFDITVNNNIKHEDVNCIKPLPETLTDFMKVSNNSCYNDTIKQRDVSYFINLIKFSLKNDGFKDFLNDGGVKCINALKESFTSCVTKSIGKITETVSKYQNLWKITGLTFDKFSYIKTKSIKHCTLNAMRTEHSTCKHKTESILYVSTLFDYMLEQSIITNPKLLEKPKSPGDKKGQNRLMGALVKDAHTSHILLALLLTLALLVILYVLFRDCCSTKGNWKISNEQFEMRRRRRSLVNNEVCQEE